MSSMPLVSGQHPKNENRRSHARLRFERLTYANLGPDNGGVLINLSEGGLSFQGVGAVKKDQLIRLNFKLTRENAPIEAVGRVAWSNETGKGGGLRFTELTDETRAQIKNWIARETFFAGTLTGQATTQTAVARGPEPSERSTVQSLPTPEKKGQLETAPTKPEPSISGSSPIATSATAAVGVTTHVSTSVVETHDGQTHRASKPLIVGFAMGLLAGCVLVLAAVVGMSKLGREDRPTTTGKAPSSSEQRAIASDNPGSLIGATLLSDSRLNSKMESVDSNLAVGPRPINGPSHSGWETNVAAKGPYKDARLAQDSRQANSVDPPTLASLASAATPAARPTLAPLAPRIPRSAASTELQVPPISDPVPTGFSSTEQLRTVTPSMPQPPPPQLEGIDRPGSFVGPALIEYAAPVYPSGIKKKVDGLVKVSATIGTDGVPRELDLVSGDPALAQAAQKAISHWRYIPAVSGGVPVESRIVIVVNFQSKP